MGIIDSQETYDARTRMLAANLAIGGALCEAFKRGDAWGFWTSDPYEPTVPKPWRPGHALATKEGM